MSNLQFPDALHADLGSNRPLSAAQKERLESLLQLVQEPMADLYDITGIQVANQLWVSEQVDCYLGQESAIHKPGDIDPHLALIIGQAEPDGPIALDYRSSPPRVVYLTGVDNTSCWVELCASYEDLVDQLLQRE